MDPADDALDARLADLRDAAEAARDAPPPGALLAGVPMVTREVAEVLSMTGRGRFALALSQRMRDVVREIIDPTAVAMPDPAEMRQARAAAREAGLRAERALATFLRAVGRVPVPQVSDTIAINGRFFLERYRRTVAIEAISRVLMESRAVAGPIEDGVLEAALGVRRNYNWTGPPVPNLVAGVRDATNSTRGRIESFRALLRYNDFARFWADPHMWDGSITQIRDLAMQLANDALGEIERIMGELPRDDPHDPPLRGGLAVAALERILGERAVLRTAFDAANVARAAYERALDDQTVAADHLQELTRRLQDQKLRRDVLPLVEIFQARIRNLVDQWRERPDCQQRIWDLTDWDTPLGAAQGYVLVDLLYTEEVAQAANGDPRASLRNRQTDNANIAHGNAVHAYCRVVEGRS